jgi:serine/threonine-protein kinase
MIGPENPHGPRGTVRLAPSRPAAPEVPQPGFFDDATQPTPLVDLAELSQRAAERRPRAEREAAAAGANPRAGDRVKDWLVTGPLAEGGFSLLYEVSHVTTRMRMALKILRPEHRTKEILVKKHLAEGKLLIHLRGNPSLCEVQDVGTSEELGPYIIMELLTGRSVRALMNVLAAKAQRFSVTNALNLVIEIAETIHTLHLLAVVHRDVKPDNIFVEERRDAVTGAPARRVKLIDFGTAKSAISPNTTAESATIMTMAYAAPELLNRQVVTGAVDQYALAVMLYEMLWQHPFAEQAFKHADKPGLMANWHATEAVEPPPEHLVPRELWAILQRALAKRPGDRYLSMKDFADALRAFLRGGFSLPEPPAGYRAPLKPTMPAGRGALRRGDARGNSPTPPRIEEKRKPKRTIALDEAVEEATLLVLAPPALRGRRFELGAEGVIGRSAAHADLVIDAAGLSNWHLRYTYVTGGAAEPVYAIEDLESWNGTDIDGEPVQTGALQVGALLGMGDVVACIVPAGKVQGDLQAFVPLRDVLAPVSAPTEALPRSRPLRRELGLAEPWPSPSLLLFAPPAMKGLRFDLGAHGVIGRNEGEVDILLADDSVSGRHVSYSLVTVGESPRDMVYLFEDLQSSNGTVVINSNNAQRQLVAGPVHGAEVLGLGEVQAMILPPGSMTTAGNGSLAFKPFDGEVRAARIAQLDARYRRLRAIAITIVVALVVFLVGFFALYHERVLR